MSTVKYVSYSLAPLAKCSVVFTWYYLSKKTFYVEFKPMETVKVKHFVKVQTKPSVWWQKLQLMPSWESGCSGWPGFILRGGASQPVRPERRSDLQTPAVRPNLRTADPAQAARAWPRPVGCENFLHHWNEAQLSVTESLEEAEAGDAGLPAACLAEHAAFLMAAPLMSE